MFLNFKFLLRSNFFHFIFRIVDVKNLIIKEGEWCSEGSNSTLLFPFLTNITVELTCMGAGFSFKNVLCFLGQYLCYKLLLHDACLVIYWRSALM